MVRSPTLSATASRADHRDDPGLGLARTPKHAPRPFKLCKNVYFSLSFSLFCSPWPMTRLISYVFLGLYAAQTTAAGAIGSRETRPTRLVAPFPPAETSTALPHATTRASSGALTVSSVGHGDIGSMVIVFLCIFFFYVVLQVWHQCTNTRASAKMQTKFTLRLTSDVSRGRDLQGTPDLCFQVTPGCLPSLERLVSTQCIEISSVKYVDYGLSCYDTHHANDERWCFLR